MTTTTAIEQAATEAAGWFETANRYEGEPGKDVETFTRTRDGAPEWVTEMVHSAHVDMLPDDWRYQAIREAVDHLADRGNPDDSHEFADAAVDVYTGRLIEWLASHGERVGYCDQAAEEFGTDEARGIVGLIALGQYAEYAEVYALVAEAIRERADEIDADA